MKMIILFLFSIPSLLFSQSEIKPTKEIFITKNNDSSFTLSTANNKNVWNLTSKNTNKLMLNKLDSLYVNSTEENKNSGVVINLPQKENDNSSIILVGIFTLLGSLGGILLTKFYDRKHYTVKQQFEKRKEWIKNLQVVVAEIIALYSQLDSMECNYKLNEKTLLRSNKQEKLLDIRDIYIRNTENLTYKIVSQKTFLDILIIPN